jgi:tetratricopeptide (TPR) repeat protein
MTSSLLDSQKLIFIRTKRELLHEGIGGFCWVTLCMEELGDFAEGIAHGEEAVRRAEAVNHPNSIVFAQLCLGRLMLRQGAMSQAISVLDCAFTRCREADFPLWTFQLAIHLALAYAASNRPAEALALLEEAASMNVGNSAIIGRMGAKRGEAYLLCGCVEEAFSHAVRTLELLCARNGRGDQAWVLRLLGNISRQRHIPDIDQAETYYQQALTLASELGMRPLQAHCHYGLGTLYRQMGREEEARAALSTAIDLYREMDMVFWLPTVEAALTVSSL